MSANGASKEEPDTLDFLQDPLHLKLEEASCSSEMGDRASRPQLTPGSQEDTFAKKNENSVGFDASGRPRPSKYPSGVVPGDLKYIQFRPDVPWSERARARQILEGTGPYSITEATDKILH
jgi:hypothetical protein